MKTINAIITTLLVSMLISAIPIGAQERASSIVGTSAIPIGSQEPATPVVGTWDAIKALPSSDELTVKLKDGSSKKGSLTDVTDTALILSQGKKLTEIRRDVIFQIYRTVRKSRKTATGAGFTKRESDCGDTFETASTRHSQYDPTRLFATCNSFLC